MAYHRSCEVVEHGLVTFGGSAASVVQDHDDHAVAGDVAGTTIGEGHVHGGISDCDIFDGTGNVGRDQIFANQAEGQVGNHR